MSITQKIQNAKTSKWISSKLSENEFEECKKIAIIAARIRLKRLEMNMSQKEFAKFMGVTQVMVSKWEHGEYNFTIKKLSEIEAKLGINLIDESNITAYNYIEKPNDKNDFNFNDYRGNLLWI